MKRGEIHFLGMILFAIFAAGQVGVGFAAPPVSICQIQGSGFTWVVITRLFKTTLAHRVR